VLVRTLRAASLASTLVLLGCSVGAETDAVFGGDGVGATTTGADGGSGTGAGGGSGTTTTSSTSTTSTTSTTSSTSSTTATGACGEGDPRDVCLPAPPAPGASITFLTSRGLDATPTDCGGLAAAGSFGEGVQADANGCTCTCGAPDGGQCQGGATLWQNGTCSGGSAQLKGGGCLDFSKNGWIIGGVGTVAPAIAIPGQCPAGVSGAPTPAKFASAVDRCVSQPTGATCAGDQVCARRPPVAVAATACVEVPQGTPCPAAYPAPRTVYEGLADGRACSAATCLCAAAQGQTCSFDVDLYPNGQCAGPATLSVPLDGMCHATGLAQGAVGSAKYVGGASGGSCQPAGVPSVAGQATGTGAHTYCCQGA
jgi:hypothetical protein